MREAVVDEFLAADVDVVVTVDPRFLGRAGPEMTRVVTPGDKSSWLGLAVSVDFTLLIAPETGGVLELLAIALEEAGGRSLGPTRHAIALTTDKLHLARRLEAAGVATPEVEPLDPENLRTPPMGFPCVVKPRDGAGAVDTFLVENRDDWPPPLADGGTWIVQRFQPGEAMSASYLVGKAGDVHLIGVGWQDVEAVGGRFTYRGGRLPAPRYLGLGDTLRAVRAVPGLRGHVGVDFVRRPGDDRVYVIEINPRVTTSFVGWRALYRPGAIARAWLAGTRDDGGPGGLEGQESDVEGTAVEFTPDGRLVRARERGEWT